MRLVNGSRVVIAGGGPAGSFTALQLQHFAAQAGLDIEITLFEARDFGRPGPVGCNKCAGILSSRLVKNLSSLDLDLPRELILAELDTYILHLGEDELVIERPDPERRIVSVYRGSGPRMGSLPLPPSFDDWLLTQVKARGVGVRYERVQTIRAGLRPMIVTRGEEFEVDLVIVANGVNSRTPLDAAWRYRAPRTETMAQDEIPLPAGIQDTQVHIFFDPPSELIFGGVIPKGRYANISLLGHHLPPKSISTFLEGNRLLANSPAGTQPLCGCMPRVVVSQASGYYADRMVVVGDAAASRLYKDGIGSAYMVAEAAARTIVEVGISRKDFALGYAPTCRQIAVDNLYGRLIFRLWSVIHRSSFLRNAWQRNILRESELPLEQQVHRHILWGMFTGDESYQQLFRLLTSRQALWGLWLSASGIGGIHE